MADQVAEIRISVPTAEAAAAISTLGNSFTGLAAPLSATGTALKTVGENLSTAGRGLDDAKGSIDLLTGGFERVHSPINQAAQVSDDFTKKQQEVRAAVAQSAVDIGKLGYEITGGNFSRIGDTLLGLVGHARELQAAFVGLGPLWGPIGAGLSLATGAVAGLVVETAKATQATQDFHGAAAFQNFDMSTGQLDAYAKQVENLTKVTGDDAKEIVLAFGGMKNASEPLMDFMIGHLAEFAQGMRMKVPEAANRLSATFSDLSRNGAQFLKDFKLGDQAIKDFNAALKDGDEVRAYGVMLNALADGANRVHGRTRIATPEQDKNAMAMANSGYEFANPAAAYNNYQENLQSVDREKTASDARLLTTALNQPMKNPGHNDEAKQQEAQRKAGAELIVETQKQVNQIDAINAGSRSDVLKAERAKWQALLDGERVTDDQKIAITKETERLDTEILRTSWAESRAAQAQQTAENDRQQRERSAKAQQTAQQQKQATIQGLEEEITGLDRKLQADRQHNQTLFQQHRMSAADLQKTEKELTQQIIEEQVKRLDKEVQVLGAETVEGRAVAARKVALERDLTNQLRTIDDQAFANKKKEADEDVRLKKEEGDRILREEQRVANEKKRIHDAAKKSWMDTFQPIENGFNGMVSNMMKGNMSLRQAAAQAGRQMLEDAVKTGAQKLIHYGMEKAAELAIAATTNTTEVAAHVAKEEMKVGGTISAEAQRTTATSVGAATRTGIETTAASESILLSIGTGIKDIAVKAAQGFAGAYAAISAIPFVGPFLAPAVAAAAFAGIIAIGSKIFSAEGGFDVPSGTNPMTQLHENEMVLPAHIAVPLRQALAASPRLAAGLGAGGGTFGGGVGGGGITHSGNINLSITAPAQALSRMSPGEAQRWVAAQIHGGMRQAYLRMAPA